MTLSDTRTSASSKLLTSTYTLITVSTKAMMQMMMIKKASIPVDTYRHKVSAATESCCI